MSDAKPITNISVFFKGIPKGKRKIITCSERLNTLDGHRLLSEEELQSWVNHAGEIIKASGYREVNAFKICVNFGSDDGHMRFVELFPKQSKWVEL